MTIQAPPHAQRVFLVHQRHFVDRAVTHRESDSLVNVDAVIEIDKIRNLCMRVHSSGLSMFQLSRTG